MKILITESSTLISNNDLSLDVFNTLGDTVIYENISRQKLLEEVKNAEVILCNKVLINREVIDSAPNLKYVGLFATGYNNIDIDYAKEKGICVCNVAGYSTNAVAQQVMGYILMQYTKIPEYNSFVKNDGWKNSPTFSALVYPSAELAGKTLGIIGYGSIGKAVEKAALGLEMNVIVYTRTPKENTSTTFVGFEELLQKSDIITVHCPLNNESADLFNKESFSKCKKGAFFINTSRGGVVDEQALLEALESGILSGAAVDVLKTEPMAETCLLSNAPNLIVTPHTAWAPLETRKRLVKLVAENLSAFLKGEPVNSLT